MHSILRLATVLAIALLHHARADDVKPQRKFVVEAWFIVVPEAAALAAQEKLLDPGAEQKVCDELIAAATKGGAKLDAHIRLNAGDGAEAAGSEVVEKKFPIEFESPVLPADKEQAAIFKDEWMVITPTTFETRNVGTSLEIKITAGEDGWLRATGRATHTRYLGEDKFECFKLKSGFVGAVEQPRFHMISNSIEAGVRSGERLLAGINRVPAPDGHWEFCILRATEQTRKVPEAKK